MPTLTNTLEKTLDLARTLADDRKREFVTTEHLLLALLDDNDATDLIRECGANTQVLRKAVIEHLESESNDLPSDYESGARPTPALQRVIQRAVIHAQSAAHEEVTGADVLRAMLTEQEIASSRILNEHGINQFIMTNFGIEVESDKIINNTAEKAKTLPYFSKEIEDTLHRALNLANEREHEYTTLEHLLLGLIDDKDAREVMIACGANIESLRETVLKYVNIELENLVTGYGDDAKPTQGFRRVIERAVLHIESSGREEVTGANVLVAILAERTSYAAYFLQEHNITRYDAAKFVAFGIRKDPETSQLEINANLQKADGDDEPNGPADFLADELSQTIDQNDEYSAPTPLNHESIETNGQVERRFVFLSYAHQDRTIAGDIQTLLKESGLPIWWDQNIAAGEQWRDEIAAKLSEASAVLTIWTANSVKSVSVREEAAQAQTDRRLVHVRSDSSELPYGFSETQYIDLREWDGSPLHPKFERLIEAIKYKLFRPSTHELASRLRKSSPISAIVKDGKLSQIDRPEYVPPPIQDFAELKRRLDAVRQLVETLLGIALDRDHFQVHPCAAHTLKGIRAAVSVEFPSWYALEDTAHLMSACLADSDAESLWHGSLYKGVLQLIVRIESIRDLLQPKQNTPEQPDGIPSPPPIAIRENEAATLMEIAAEAEAAFDSEEAAAVVGNDLRSSAARAMEEIKDTELQADHEKRSKRLRAATTKLTYIIGAITTAVAGGVATSLLTAPEAAITLTTRLEAIYGRLLQFFY